MREKIESGGNVYLVDTNSKGEKTVSTANVEIIRGTMKSEEIGVVKSDVDALNVIKSHSGSDKITKR